MKTITDSPEVLQMIQDRSTELQRVYDDCIMKKCEILDWFDEYNEQFRLKQEKLREINIVIDKCESKAKEYGKLLKINIL